MAVEMKRVGSFVEIIDEDVDCLDRGDGDDELGICGCEEGGVQAGRLE